MDFIFDLIFTQCMAGRYYNISITFRFCLITCLYHSKLGLVFQNFKVNFGIVNEYYKNIWTYFEVYLNKYSPFLMHTRKPIFLMFQIKFPDHVEVENLAGFEGHFKTIVLYSTVHGSHFFLHMWVAGITMCLPVQYWVPVWVYKLSRLSWKCTVSASANKIAC